MAASVNTRVSGIFLTMARESSSGFQVRSFSHASLLLVCFLIHTLAKASANEHIHSGIAVCTSLVKLKGSAAQD